MLNLISDPSLYLAPFLVSLGGALLLLWLFVVGRLHGRLGGAALITVFVLTIFLDKHLIVSRPLEGIIIGCLVILFFGVCDDFLNLKPSTQFFGQALAALSAVFYGVRIDFITNPFGGAFHLDFFYLNFIFAFFWIVFLINVVNWLDGIDGLASGLGLINFVVLFFLSIGFLVNQPPLGVIAAVLIGVFSAFLFFNFPPAKIMLGTSGSFFLGYLLAALSIFAGGKIATTMLVMAVPALDSFWVVFKRVKGGASVFLGDKSHLHYELEKRGWSKKNILFIFYSAGILAGAAALFLKTKGKLLFFIAMILIMAMSVWRIEKEEVSMREK